MNLEARNPRRTTRGKSYRIAWLSFFPLLFCCLCSLGSCKREERGFRVVPPAAEKIQSKSLSDLHPAGGFAPPPAKNEYEENAYATAEGQRLFTAYNCVGCHAHGGGGMGPALMDEKWLYGHEPEDIYSTIMQGRPNGMPSFRGRIPNDTAILLYGNQPAAQIRLRPWYRERQLRDRARG